MPDPSRRLPAPSESKADYRSVCIIVEPVVGSTVTWRSMAFAGGECVNNITGMDRTVVLDDSLCALAAAGIEVEPGDPDA